MKVMLLLLFVTQLVTSPPWTGLREASESSLFQVSNSHLGLTLTPVPITSHISLSSNRLDLSTGSPIDIGLQHVGSWLPICYCSQLPQATQFLLASKTWKFLFNLFLFLYPNPIKHDFTVSLLTTSHKFSPNTLSLQPWL